MLVVKCKVLYDYKLKVSWVDFIVIVKKKIENGVLKNWVCG